MARPLTRPWERRGPGPAEAFAVLAALAALEAGLFSAKPRLGQAEAIWLTGALRAAEAVLCLVYWRARGWRLEELGLTGTRVGRGLWVGALFSAGLGACVGGVEAAGRLFLGLSPLAALAGPRPPPGELAALLVVGAGVAPLFEELVFRGILYGGLRRRLSPFGAGAVATGAFAAAHLLSPGIPWVQAVGGLVFVAAYELSGSLWAPVLVHACGNAVLFLLPFWLG
ncbi:MAG: CPBP family intramembrane glutamic endopeptidase [Deferrisomatales bacterium]|nr:CPBP family intramembrane glutamic endopeptidase [Deferrisomatales bacterium]